MAASNRWRLELAPEALVALRKLVTGKEAPTAPLTLDFSPVDPAPDDPLMAGYAGSGFYGPGRPMNVHSTALENSHVVKSGAGLLYGFTAYSNKASAQFIHIYDLATTPSNGAVPDVVFSVATVDIRAAEWVVPRTFRTGCVITNSTTAATLTLGAADTYFDVQFL